MSFGVCTNMYQRKPLHFTYLWKQECGLYIRFPQTVLAHEETRFCLMFIVPCIIVIAEELKKNNSMSLAVLFYFL